MGTYNKVKPEPLVCKYNVGVDCDQKQNACMGCGWNPAVAKYRTEKFCRKKGITISSQKED